MPAGSTVFTLANGETTPVNHSFYPMGRDRDGFWWFEDPTPRVASSSQLGWPRLGLRPTRAPSKGVGGSSKNLVNTVDIILQLPGLEALGTSDSGLTPAPTISYIDRFRGTFYLHARDNTADRKDMLAYVKNLCGHAQIQDLVHNLTNFY